MRNQQTSRWGRLSRGFLKDEEGNSSLEYATMLSLIGVTLLPLVQAVGGKLSGINSSVADTLATSSTESSVSGNSFSATPVPSGSAESLPPDLLGSAPESPVRETQTAPGQQPAPQSPSPPPPEAPAYDLPDRKP